MTERERVSLKELAERAAVNESCSVAGAPGDKCPYCKSDLEVEKVIQRPNSTERYAYCPKHGCGKGFITKQPLPVIIREVNRHEKGNKNSTGGKVELTIYRETA